MGEIYERNPELIMDDKTVILEFQGLEDKKHSTKKSDADVDKLANDWVEGDADFNVFYDDVDWCE